MHIPPPNRFACCLSRLFPLFFFNDFGEGFLYLSLDGGFERLCLSGLSCSRISSVFFRNAWFCSRSVSNKESPP
jgi:hypothetical protein